MTMTPELWMDEQGDKCEGETKQQSEKAVRTEIEFILSRLFSFV